MGIRFNTNTAALSLARNLNQGSEAMSASVERVSSGSRIRGAGDDAAALSISSNLNAAARSEQVDETLLDTLKKAHAIEPANPRTAYEIGENLRLLSWEGLDGYEARAREAIPWLEKAASLNPFDAYAPLRLGMTLHWIQQRDQAAKAFDRALTLGPNDVQIANHCAWDLMLRGDTRRARELLEASLRWWPWGNWMAQHYLEALNRAGITNAPPAKP